MSRVHLLRQTAQRSACRCQSQARPFTSTARLAKVNQKLKPDGSPEPLHVPGSGIQHSSQIDQTHGPFMTAIAKFGQKLLGSKQIYYAAYQPSMDLYVQSAAQAAQSSPSSSSTSSSTTQSDTSSRNPKAIVAVSAMKFWYSEADLPTTFQTWFQITQLHLWMLMVRLRALPKDVGHHYQQQLTNHFFNDAEARLRVVYQIRDGRIIQTYMKDLLLQWRGSTAAYDQALIDGDAVLLAALWRNMYGARKDASLVHLEKMVEHVRSNLKVLEGVSDESMQAGKFDFTNDKLLK